VGFYSDTKSTILKLGVAFMILLVTTTSLELNIAHAVTGQQAQLPSSSLSKPISVKITSPIRGQQVPVGNNLTVSGVSKYNATSNCQVFVILDGIKPYQKALPIGSSEADYSNWKYVLSAAYPATIKEGTNKITAKLLCQADPTNLRKFYSINVTGVPNLENLAFGSNNTSAGPSFLSLAYNSSLTNPLLDPAAANATNSVVPDPSTSSGSGSSDNSHHHHSSSTHHSHHHDTSNSDNNSVKNGGNSGSSGSSDSISTDSNNIFNPNPLAQKIINHVKQELKAHGITIP
jgi:hypothetical protein